MNTQLRPTANEEIDLPHRIPAGHQSGRGAIMLGFLIALLAFIRAQCASGCSHDHNEGVQHLVEGTKVWPILPVRG